MIDHKSPVTEDELHAYVDGELPADRVLRWRHGLPRTPTMPRASARGAAGGCNSCAFRRDRERRRFRMRLKVDTLLRSGRKWRAIAAAVAAFAFLVGGVAGWMARSTSEVVAAVGDPADEIAQGALSAHKLYIAEIRHPIEVAASEAHMMPWLSRRLGTTLRIPDFTDFDMKLLGGRLLPGEAGPAALFMYENGSGDRVTFYMFEAGAAANGVPLLQSDNVAAIRWVVSDLRLCRQQELPTRPS